MRFGFGFDGEDFGVVDDEISYAFVLRGSVSMHD